MFWLNKAVWFISNPITVGLAMMLLALVMKRLRKVLLIVVVVWFYCLSTGWCFRMVGGMLEREFTQMEPAQYQEADAIVLLGGGVCNRENNRIGFPELTSSADRVYFAAKLWQAGKAPIIITTNHDVTNIDNRVLMDLGVTPAAIISETEATTTEENAKFVNCILTTNHQPLTTIHPPLTTNHQALTTILLVTSAWHMKRSLYMFEKYAPNIKCIPAACDYEVMTRESIAFKDFMPDPRNFELTCRFLHEWLGLVGYHFRR